MLRCQLEPWILRPHPVPLKLDEEADRQRQGPRAIRADPAGQQGSGGLGGVLASPWLWRERMKTKQEACNCNSTAMLHCKATTPQAHGEQEQPCAWSMPSCSSTMWYTMKCRPWLNIWRQFMVPKTLAACITRAHPKTPSRLTRCNPPTPLLHPTGMHHGRPYSTLLQHPAAGKARTPRWRPLGPSLWWGCKLRGASRSVQGFACKRTREHPLRCQKGGGGSACPQDPGLLCPQDSMHKTLQCVLCGLGTYVWCAACWAGAMPLGRGRSEEA